MIRLAISTLKGHWGQTLAVGATLLFSAVLIGALGSVLQTGIKGQVSTGEYAAAPVLVGAPQAVPVADDVDMAVAGRALLPAGIVDEIARVLPDARVVPDRVVPATFLAGRSVPIDVHAWSALALGDRKLAAGRAPSSEDEIALPEGLAASLGMGTGDTARIDFGDGPEEALVVGVVNGDDAGVDVPDAYMSVDGLATRSRSDDPVFVVGVWPQLDSGAAELAHVLAEHGARTWHPEDRGAIEVVAQARAKGSVVAAVAALGAIALIVSLVTVMAIVSLHIRERSGELAVLRVVGATPRQVKVLLLAEIRFVALGAVVVGAVVGPLLGWYLLDLIRSWGVVPASLEPVAGPLPALAAVLTGVCAAEIAARVALRRIVRGSPLMLRDHTESAADRARHSLLRPALGLGLLGLGLTMALAPLYSSNLDVATGLSGLAGLVMALSIGALSPFVVRGATRLLGGPAAGSATAYLAIRSIRHRANRVGGALTPLVLGVALATVQLAGSATASAVAADQQRAGYRPHLTLTSTTTGVGEPTVSLVRGVPGVGSATPFVVSEVVALPAGDNGPLRFSAFGVAGDRAADYADLDVRGGAAVRLGPGDVALGSLGAAELGARVGDSVVFVLADGSRISRKVVALYGRGLGFGQVFLPVDDLRAATASGLSTGVLISSDDTGVSPTDLEERLRALFPGRTDVQLSAGPAPNASDSSGQRFQLLMLAVVFGYIAVAATNSIVLATLSRRREFDLLSAVGATPVQRRHIWLWESLFVALVAVVVGTVVALIGLMGMAYALSHGDRYLPALHPMASIGIACFSFLLVLASTTLSARALRRRGSTPPTGSGPRRRTAAPSTPGT